MDRRLLRARGTLALASAALLAACGGDGSDPTPPETDGQTVTVTVATSGEDVDADGYTVALGGRSAAVGSSGSVSFEDVAPGTYEVRLTGVADNCAVDGGDARSVTVSEASGAQASFAVTCEAGDALVIVACPDLTMSVASAPPLAFVGIGDLPSTLGDAPWALLSLGGEAQESPAFVDVGGDGVARVLVPLHPDGRLDGGTVRIRFTDGQRACAPVEFGVEPLPPAEGELVTVVELLEALIEQRAAAFGITPEDLEVAHPDDLPDHLLPLMIAHEGVSGPDHEHSLRALLEGDLDPEAVVLAEAVLAHVDLAGTLADAVAAGPSLATRHAGADQVSLPCTTIGESEVDQLDACMKAAKNALEGPSDALLAKVHQLQTAVTLLGLAGGSAGEVAAAVSKAIQALAQAAFQGAGGMLPSYFTELTFQHDPWFHEDSDTTGTWDRALATAASRGVHITVHPLDGLDDALGPVADQLIAFLEGVANFPASSIEDGVARTVAGALAALALEGGTFTRPPQLFGPVDVTSEAWSRVDVESGTSIVLEARDRYRPVRAGTSRLRVRTDDGRFGGEQAVGVMDVEVRAIAVQVGPPETWVEPGDTTFVLVLVENALHPDSIELHPDVELQGFGTLQLFAEQPYFVRHIAPARPDFSKPDSVTVRHMGRAGARATGEPPREGFALVRFAEVVISPPGGCVDFGEPIQFEAEVQGLSNESVTWSLVDGPGDLDNDGHYTAPTDTEVATATIRASSDQVPDIDDEVTIQIGGCTCSWSVILDGELFEGQPGDTASFHELVPGGAFDRLIQIRLTGAGGQFVTIGPDESIVTGPATFAGDVAGNIGTSVAPPFIAYETRHPGPYVGEEPEWAETDVVLVKYDFATALSGSASGTVALHGNELNIDEAPRVSFEANFDITVPADYSEVLRYQRRFQCEVPPDGTP